MDKKEIFAAILNERKRQDDMHYFPLELSEQMMILMEEIGEVFMAMNNKTNNSREELVQCAAVIVRILENWNDFK